MPVMRGDGGNSCPFRAADGHDAPQSAAKLPTARPVQRLDAARASCDPPDCGWPPSTCVFCDALIVQRVVGSGMAAGDSALIPAQVRNPMRNVGVGNGGVQAEGPESQGNLRLARSLWAKARLVSVEQRAKALRRSHHGRQRALS